MTRRASARIDVVVPARDEEDHVSACLVALGVAVAHLRDRRPDVAVGVTLVLDDCADRTGALAAAAAARDPALTVLEARLGAVGPARLLGVRAALDVAGPPVRNRWIANTDADSRVDPRWLLQQLDALERDAAVLVGAVVPDPEDLAPEVLARWLLTHPPGATLGHVHGANLGIRADVHERLGGFEPIAEHEDVRLVAAARAAGFRVEATEEFPVVTSGRFAGRTPGGYAEHLRAVYGDAAIEAS
ncbi:glycosyltransferase [Curtobacterium sp. RRHDQ10]|uniref:glycosyltransferase n=1 Tax=Curtobacterium phyllosphaerae TaxID=3413379 RepID=UPI003BF0C895